MAAKRASLVPEGTDNGTRLDDNVSEPSTTQAGDAPYDTKDPTENASTVTPVPSADALRVGTVNGAVPIPPVEAAEQDPADIRVDEYDRVLPDGSTVRIRHTLDGPDAGKTERI